jgi:hypothetical protein
MSLDQTLRDLMADRSSGREVPPGHLDRIHRRYARRRAGRLAAGGAAAVVTLTTLAATALAWPGGDRPPVIADGSAAPSATAVQPPTVKPVTLPDLDRGQSLVEQTTGALSPGHGEVTLVHIPRQWNFSIAVGCVTTGTDQQIEVLINGGRRPYFVADCGADPTVAGLPDQPPTDEEDERRWWQNVHTMTGADTPVALGTPMTITVRVGAKQEVSDPRVEGKVIRSGPFTARAGRAAVGIYQPA